MDLIFQPSSIPSDVGALPLPPLYFLKFSLPEQTHGLVTWKDSVNCPPMILLSTRLDSSPKNTRYCSCLEIVHISDSVNKCGD